MAIPMVQPVLSPPLTSSDSLFRGDAHYFGVQIDDFRHSPIRTARWLACFESALQTTASVTLGQGQGVLVPNNGAATGQSGIAQVG